MSDQRVTRAQRKRHLEAADWIFRNAEAGRSAADKAAFQKWLARDPENARAYEAASRLMGEARIAIEADPELRDTLNRTPREIAVMRGFIDVAAEFVPVAPGAGASMARFLRDRG